MTTRLTVEDVSSFSVQSLKGMMDHQSLILTLGDWAEPFKIQTMGNRFTIRPQGTTDHQTVLIEHTAVGYGMRAWFCCPSCKKRCSRLYMRSGVFGCRVCHDLTYTSCQISGNRFVILTREVRKLQRELGMSSKACINELPPINKPKGMRWERFCHLSERLFIAQRLRFVALIEQYGYL